MKNPKTIMFMIGTVVGMLLFFAIGCTINQVNWIQNDYDNSFSSGITHLSSALTQEYYSKNKEIQKIANNITYGCEDDFCKSFKLYKHIRDNFDYEVGTNFNFFRVWGEKECDCDECSNLYIILLKSLGIDSKIQCNTTHCWSVVYLEDKIIWVDITIPSWIENENN